MLCVSQVVETLEEEIKKLKEDNSRQDCFFLFLFDVVGQLSRLLIGLPSDQIADWLNSVWLCEPMRTETFTQPKPIIMAQVTFHCSGLALITCWFVKLRPNGPTSLTQHGWVERLQLSVSTPCFDKWFKPNFPLTCSHLFLIAVLDTCLRRTIDGRLF